MNEETKYLQWILASSHRLERQVSYTNLLLSGLFIFLVVLPAIKPILRYYDWWNLLDLPG
jgi:hypothetical protein